MGSHEHPRDYWVGELRAQLGQDSRKAEEDPLVREHIVAVAQAPHRTYPHQGKARGCSSGIVGEDGAGDQEGLGALE